MRYEKVPPRAEREHKWQSGVITCDQRLCFAIGAHEL